MGSQVYFTKFSLKLKIIIHPFFVQSSNTDGIVVPPQINSLLPPFPPTLPSILPHPFSHTNQHAIPYLLLFRSTGGRYTLQFRIHGIVSEIKDSCVQFFCLCIREEESCAIGIHQLLGVVLRFCCGVMSILGYVISIRQVTSYILDGLRHIYLLGDVIFTHWVTLSLLVGYIISTLCDTSYLLARLRHLCSLGVRHIYSLDYHISTS